MKYPCKGHIRFSPLRFSRSLLFVVLFTKVLFQLFSAMAQDSESISKKMELILIQQEKASNKLLLASRTRQYLAGRSREFEQEIIGLKNEKEISSYTKAIQFGRIRYNLQLLGQLSAYARKIDEKIQALKAIQAELGYLYQRLSDDLRIIETIENIDTAGQLKQVEKAIQQYSWLDEPYLFKTHGLSMPKPEKMWRDAVSGKSGG